MYIYLQQEKSMSSKFITFIHCPPTFLETFLLPSLQPSQKPRTTTTTRAWCSAKDPTCNSAKVPSQPNDLNSHSPSSAIFFLRWDFQELDLEGNPTQPFQEQKQQKSTNLGAFKIHPSPQRSIGIFFRFSFLEFHPKAACIFSTHESDWRFVIQGGGVTPPKN